MPEVIVVKNLLLTAHRYEKAIWPENNDTYFPKPTPERASGLQSIKKTNGGIFSVLFRMVKHYAILLQVKSDYVVGMNTVVVKIILR